MPSIATIFQDPFAPTLFASEPLVLSDEQKLYIRKVLDICSSDSRFADKAYVALVLILSGGSVEFPVVTSLNPATAVLGSPNFDIHVMGTGFKSGDVIVFNGFDEPTTFVSETELTTGINMAVWAAPAVLPVQIRSVDGILSDPLPFEFTEAALQSTSVKSDPKKKDDPSFLKTPTSEKFDPTAKESKK